MHAFQHLKSGWGCHQAAKLTWRSHVVKSSLVAKGPSCNVLVLVYWLSVQVLSCCEAYRLSGYYPPLL